MTERWIVELEGVVHNGVIVPNDSTRLAEGDRVRIVVTPVAENHDFPRRGHSVLDIPPVSIGAVLQTQALDDDLLGEMLEGRL